jgi:hypothetical protein
VAEKEADVNMPHANINELLNQMDPDAFHADPEDDDEFADSVKDRDQRWSQNKIKQKSLKSKNNEMDTTDSTPSILIQEKFYGRRIEMYITATNA